MALLKNFFALSICIFLATNLYSYVDINGSGQGYNTSNDGDKQLSLDANYIEGYIVEAAGYFLQAHSDILYFSNLYELSGDSVDSDQWRQVLDGAARHVQDTKMTYIRLIDAAGATPYYQPVIDKLKNFDYRGFGSRNNLNMEAFGEVEAFLKDGNITGVFKEVFYRLETIELILNRIRGEINIGIMPQLSDVWQLNEAFSKKLMFGQYVAMVFFNLDQ